MRERTPSADDTPKRAPPAPPREAASADVLVDGRSARVVVGDSTRASSELSSSTERRIITMVASTQGLDKLGTSQSTINDRQQQQQHQHQQTSQSHNYRNNHQQHSVNNNNHHNYPERQGIGGYRSAQTAQDKRSRLSNVINNLRKKVPTDNSSTAITAPSVHDSRRTKDTTSHSNAGENRQEDEARNSVERNLANLEKYVMTVLNGVIKDAESKDDAKTEVDRGRVTCDSLNESKNTIESSKVEKSVSKCSSERDDPRTYSPEPARPNESRLEAAVPGTTRVSPSETTFDKKESFKNEETRDDNKSNAAERDSQLDNDESRKISRDKRLIDANFREESTTGLESQGRPGIDRLSEIDESWLGDSSNSVAESTSFENSSTDGARSSSLSTRDPRDNEVKDFPTSRENIDLTEETILNSELEKRNNRTLGTLILERLDHQMVAHETVPSEANFSMKILKTEEDSESSELRTICRDLLNELLNDISQLIEEEKPPKIEEKFEIIATKCDDSKESRTVVDSSNTSIQCSLPLDKVASMLQNCHNTSDSVLPMNPSPQQASKILMKSVSPTVRHLCLYCDRKFLSISLRQRHTERVHQLGGGRRSERNSRKTTQNCQYCSDKCADNLDSLFQHMIVNHTDKYHACVQCITRYSTRDTLVNHMSDIHGLSWEKIGENRDKSSNKDTGSHKETAILSVREHGSQCPREKTDGAAASDRRSEEEQEKRENETGPVTSLSKNMNKGGPSQSTSKEPTGNPGNPEFDSTFYSSVSCNIRENLLHHLDGKLQIANGPPGVASNEIKSPQHSQQQQSFYDQNAPSQAQFSIDISLTAATPVYSKEYVSDEYENSSEYAQKPDKTSGRSHPRRVSFEKYNFPRKYDGKEQWSCSIKDLSKFDISTQLTLRKKQQLIKERLTTKRLRNATTVTTTTTSTTSTEICQAEIENLPNDSETVVGLNFDRIEDLRVRHVELQSINARTMTSQRDVESFTPGDTESSRNADEGSTSVTEFTAEFGNFLRLRKWNECNVEGRKNEEIVYAELTGEWSRPRVYICGACTSKHLTLRELEEHKATSHPNVWCSHLEFTGDQRELYKHLFLPGRSVATSKAKNAVLSEKVCTKCSKVCGSLAELHRHMLECGGDQAWLLGLFGNGKKKCKWRPFGSRSRRRRQRGMKRNIQNSQTPRVNQPRERNSSGPRVRPSDRESIQKMLANLPPKRASRRVMQDTTVRTQGRLRKMQTRSRPRLVDSTSSSSRLSQKAVLRNKLLKNAKSFQRKRCRGDNITAAIESVVKNSDIHEDPEDESDEEEELLEVEEDEDEEEEEGEEEEGEEDEEEEEEEEGEEEEEEEEEEDDDEEEEEEEEDDDDVEDDSGRVFKESRKFECPKAHGEASKVQRNLESSNRSTQIVRGVRVVSKKRNVKSKNPHTAIAVKSRVITNRRGVISASTQSRRKSTKNSTKNNDKVGPSGENIIDVKSMSSTSSSPSHSAILRRKKHVDPVVSLHASLKARNQLRTHDGKFARKVVEPTSRTRGKESVGRVSARKKTLVVIRATEGKGTRKKLVKKNTTVTEKPPWACLIGEKRVGCPNPVASKGTAKKNNSDMEKQPWMYLLSSRGSNNSTGKTLTSKSTTEMEKTTRNSPDERRPIKVTRKTLLKKNTTEMEKQRESIDERIDNEEEASREKITSESPTMSTGKSKKSLTPKRNSTTHQVNNGEIDLDEAIVKNVIDVTRIKNSVQSVDREERPTRGRRKKIVDEKSSENTEKSTSTVASTVREITTKSRSLTRRVSSTSADRGEESSSRRATSKDSRFGEIKGDEDVARKSEKLETPQGSTKKIETINTRRARQERRAGSLEDFSKIREVHEEVKRLLGPSKDLLTQIGLKTRESTKKTRVVQRATRVNSPRTKGQKKNSPSDEKQAEEAEKIVLRVSPRKADKREMRSVDETGNERGVSDQSGGDSKISASIDEIPPEETKDRTKTESNVGKRRGRIKSRVEHENIETSAETEKEEERECEKQETTKDVAESIETIENKSPEETIEIATNENPEELIEIPVNKNPEESIEIPVDENVENLVETITNKSPEESIETILNKNLEESIETTVKKNPEESVEKTVNKSIEETIETSFNKKPEEPIERIACKSLEESIKKMFKKNIDPSIVSKHLDESIELAINKNLEDPIETIIRENLVEPINAIVDKNSEELVQRIVNKNLDESIGMAVIKNLEASIEEIANENPEESMEKIITTNLDKSIETAVNKNLEASVEKVANENPEESVEKIVTTNLENSMRTIDKNLLEESLEIVDKNLEVPIEIVDKNLEESIDVADKNLEESFEIASESIEETLEIVNKNLEESSEHIDQSVDESIPLEASTKGPMDVGPTLSFEHLQQESNNSNIDSGKENSSETAVNVSKPKVVRPKKSRGSRRERMGKRTLSNVIGILTEGVNIPVEIQQSVVLTVQTSIEATSETGNPSNSSQITNGSNVAAGEASNVRASMKPNESSDAACSSAVSEDCQISQEMEKIEKTDIEDTERIEKCEKMEKTSENVEIPEKNPETIIRQPEVVGRYDPPEVATPVASLLVKTIDPVQSATIEPTNDIILDLSRRKPKGKGSFLEKIVSKIAKQKDALLEGDVGCLLDSAADELTSILSEISPPIVEQPEVSRIDAISEKITDPMISDDKESREEKITPSIVVPVITRNEGPVSMQTCVASETNDPSEKQAQPAEEEILGTGIIPTFVEEFSAAPEISTLTIEDLETGVSESKRTSKKRSLDAVTPRKNKRKTVDERVVEEDLSEDEMCLADIMKLINRTKQTSPRVDEKSEQKIHSGKRKIVEVEKDEVASSPKSSTVLSVEESEDNMKSRSNGTEVKKSKRNCSKKLQSNEDSSLERIGNDDKIEDSSLAIESTSLEVAKSPESVESSPEDSSTRIDSKIEEKVEAAAEVAEKIIDIQAPVVEKSRSRPARKCASKKKSLADEHLNLSEDEDIDEILPRAMEEIGSDAFADVSSTASAAALSEIIASSRTIESFKVPDVGEFVTSRKRVTRKKSLPDNSPSIDSNTSLPNSILPAEMPDFGKKHSDTEEREMENDEEKKFAEEIDIVEEKILIDGVTMENNHAARIIDEAGCEPVELDETEDEKKSSRKRNFTEDEKDSSEDKETEDSIEDGADGEAAAERRRSLTRRAKETTTNEELAAFSDGKLQRKFAVVHTKSGKMLIVEKKKKFTKEAAKFFCEVCAASFTRKSSLKKHNSSQSHLLQVAKYCEDTEKGEMNDESNVLVDAKSEYVAKINENSKDPLATSNDTVENIDNPESVTRRDETTSGELQESPEQDPLDTSDENQEQECDKAVSREREPDKVVSFDQECDNAVSLEEVCNEVVSPEREFDKAVTPADQTEESSIEEKKLIEDDFEDELLDEEICKITENMTHDEYVLTDHVSPVVPEASSTPVVDISAHVPNETSDDIGKIGATKNVEKTTRDQDSAKINLANEHLNLDSPVPDEILAEATSLLEDCTEIKTLSDLTSTLDIPEAPSSLLIKSPSFLRVIEENLIEEKSIEETCELIGANLDSITSSGEDFATEKSSRSRRRSKRSIAKVEDSIFKENDIFAPEPEEKCVSPSKEEDSSIANTIVEQFITETEDSKDGKLEIFEDKPVYDFLLTGDFKQCGKINPPVVLDFSNITEKLKSQATNPARDISCGAVEFESDDDTLDTNMSDDIRKILDDPELDTDNRQIVEMESESPDNLVKLEEKLTPKRMDPPLTDSGLGVPSKRNKQKAKSEESSCVKREKTVKKSSRNKSATKETVKRSRSSKPRKNANSSKTKIEDTSESEYDEKKDAMESQSKSKIVKCVFGRVFGGEKVDKVKEVLDDWVSRSEGDSHDDTQMSVDLSVARVEKIIPSTILPVESKRSRKDEEKSSKRISRSSSHSESRSPERGRGKKRGRSKNPDATSGSEYGEKNRSTDEARSRSGTLTRRKNPDRRTTNNESSTTQASNDLGTSSRCRQSKKRAEERISRAFEDESSIAFDEHDLLNQLSLSVSTKHARNFKEPREESDSRSKRQSLTIKSKKRSQDDDTRDRNESDVSENENSMKISLNDAPRPKRQSSTSKSKKRSQDEATRDTNESDASENENSMKISINDAPRSKRQSSMNKSKKRSQDEDTKDINEFDESESEKNTKTSLNDGPRTKRERSVLAEENSEKMKSVNARIDVSSDVHHRAKDDDEEEEEDEDEIALGRLSPFYVCNTPESSIDSSSNSEGENEDVGRDNRGRSTSEIINDKIAPKSPIAPSERTEISAIVNNDEIEDNALDVSRDHVNSPSQKSRQGKVLNFDEELFVECCSRLKATTENELRGAKKIKLDHNETYERNEDQSQGFRCGRDRWRDVESQNSLGSLLESVNQLLGEEMYSGNRANDYQKRGRNNGSEKSSRTASPDIDANRQENLGYEDSLDVAFEHNNKLRVKIQQRMRESENLIASTFGQKTSSGSSSQHRHHHRHHHHREPNHQRHHENSHNHRRESRQIEHGRKENTRVDRSTILNENLLNGENYDDRASEKTLEQSNKHVELDCSGFRTKNPALGGLIDNLLHSNGKHDHNGSTPMNVLAELACARVPTSTLPELNSSSREKSTKSPTRTRDSSSEDRKVASKEVTPKKPPRNPIRELFERKKEINERKHHERADSDVALRELNVQRQKKSRKPRKQQQDFPLIRKSQLGGMVERKKRREEKKIVVPNSVQERVKDIYDFDEDESQQAPSTVMSYRNKNEKNYEVVNSMRAKQIDMTDLMAKTIGETLKNGKTGEALGRRLESMIDRKFQEIESFPPKTKGALKSFQIEEKQHKQQEKREEQEDQRVTGPMDDFIDRKQQQQQQQRSRKLTEQSANRQHGRSKRRSKNSKKKSRNAWYENDSSDEFVTAARAEDVGVGTTKSQRTCSKGKQNLFAELSTSSESDYENGDDDYEANRRASRNRQKVNEEVSRDNDNDDKPSRVIGENCSEAGEDQAVVDWISVSAKIDGKNEPPERKKSESEMSDHPLIIDERKNNETDETRNSDDDTEARYVPAFELDDLYREDTTDETDEETNERDDEKNILDDTKTLPDVEIPRRNEKEIYRDEKELIPLEEALDLLDNNEDLSRIPERIRGISRCEESMEKNEEPRRIIMDDSIRQERKVIEEDLDNEVSNNEEPDEESELPEKLSTNEKPQKESDNLPLHVFLSRKVQESKKRKQQQAKKLQEEQDRILMDFQPTRRQRKCAIGKQGLLAEISSSDEESYARETCRRATNGADKPDNERQTRKPKRESKEKRKERYIEKKHEQIIAKEQKAIEEEILRELEKTKGSSVKSDSESGKSGRNVFKDDSMITDKSEGDETRRALPRTGGSTKKRRQQKSRKSATLEEDLRNNGERRENENVTLNNSLLEIKSNSDENHDTNEQDSPSKPRKQSKSGQRAKKSVKTAEAKTSSASRKSKIANGEKSKSRPTSAPSKDPKERRSSCGKRDSDDEELRTTKCWNKVDEGVGVAIGRRKRAAANQLYYWSSSSDDEEPIPTPAAIVEEEDDRQEQHGWIVGDSHKRMITMLAMEKQLKEKRRRSEDEFEPGKTKNKKHRNSTS